MNVLWLDIEVFNERDIKDIGSWEHTRTGELVLITWALNDEPVQAVEFESRRVARPGSGLKNFVDAWDAADIVVSHGAYDRLGLMHLLGLERPLEEWRCCMTKALSMGLPGSLDAACKWLGIPGKLDSQNMLKFARPRKPTKNNPDTRWTKDNDPDGYAQFVEYAIQDTESMRALWKALPSWNYGARELALWRMDQRMNDLGLPIDVAAAAGAVAIATPEEEQLNKQFRALTGLNMTQRDKIKAWLAAQGVDLPNMRRETLEAIDVDKLQHIDQVREALELKLRAGRATVAKFRKLLTIAPDGVARHQFAFNGAQRTMRWAGRDVQPQNMLRPLHKLDPRNVAGALAVPQMDGETLDMVFGDGTMPLLDIVSSGIRGTIQAPEGQMFTVGDLAQIEARIVLWLAEQWDILEAFADPDRDPYVEMAAEVGQSGNRQLGKVLVLACGFGMGWVRFQETARDVYGLSITDGDAEDYVKTWRKVNAKVTTLWERVGRSFRDVMGDDRKHVMSVGEANLIFDRTEILGQTLVTIQVPSGQKLCYWDPQHDEGGLSVRDPRVGRKHIWGGFLVENIVQMIARHIMAGGMQRIEQWLPLVGTVHDEAIGMGPEVDTARMEHDLTVRPDWAQRLPLAAEVYSTRRYTK